MHGVNYLLGLLEWGITSVTIIYSALVSNGGTPDSARSVSGMKSKTKDIMQMKNGLKSASEPNLSKFLLDFPGFDKCK